MAIEYSNIALNLLGVIILILFLMYILNRLKIAKYSNNKHIKIINTVSIGTRERLILLDINNTKLLIGATQNHIETLYVFNELERELVAENNTNFAEKIAALQV